jgi:putative membrane protein
LRAAFNAVVLTPLALPQNVALPQIKARSAQQSISDQQFLSKAAEGGIAEVHLGQLAGQNGANRCVKQFGQRMVSDHATANEHAKSVGIQKGIVLPVSMNPAHQSTYRNLSIQTGKEFDKAYMAEMIRDHREDIAEFRSEAESGSDADIKAWAVKTLPMLEEHLHMAESCGGQVGVVTPTTGGDHR